MVRYRNLLVLLAAFALFAAACGDDDEPATTATTTTTAATTAPEVTSVGMALPGPQNDKGFNEAHYRGIVLATDTLGIVPNVQENVVDPDARIDALRNLAADNPLVIGVGAEFAEAGLTIAPQFPDVTFMIINGQTDPAIPNLYVYGVRQGVPAYVAGVLAASGLLDEGIDTIGYVGGEEIPPTTQSDDAIAGAIADTDPSIEYVSTIVGDFNDAPGAKDAAEAQIAAGSDVIFGLVDAGFTGVIQAAEEAGGDVFLFSVIFPRCGDYPKLVGTAFLNSDILVESMIADFLNGTIPAQPLFYGVENLEIQRLQLCPNFATPELVELVDATQAGIVDGSIQLPDGV